MRTPIVCSALLLIGTLSGMFATDVAAQPPASDAVKYQRFHKNLKALAMNAQTEKTLAKDVQTRLQDGPPDTDISNPEQYLQKLGGAVLSISKALPGLAGSVVGGAGVLLAPQQTAVEISDALNFAQNMDKTERQKIVMWTMWTLPPEGFLKLLKGNPGFADRMLLVLAGKI